MHMPVVLVHFFHRYLPRAYPIIVLGAEQMQRGVNTEGSPLLSQRFQSEGEDTYTKQPQTM